MKKIFFVFFLLVSMLSSLNASNKYSCARYVNGKYAGHTFVRADSKREAENKAYDKYLNKLKKKVDYVICKMEFI